MTRPSLDDLLEMAAAGETTLAIQQFEGAWFRYWYEADPMALRSFLSLLPLSEVGENTAVHLVAVAVGAVPEHERYGLYEQAVRRAQRLNDDHEVLLSHLLVMAHHRRNGDLQEAHAQLDLARPLLRRLDSALVPSSGGMASFARIQFGMTALLAGDLVAALAWLESSVDHGVPSPLGFMRRYVAAMMAMTSAMSGEMAAAEDWLIRCQRAERGYGWIEPMIDGAEHLARLIIAMETWHFDDAEQLVRARQPASFGELWPIAFWAQTRYLMLSGRDTQSLRLAIQASIAEPPGSQDDGLARDVLLAARIESLTALGQLREAWEIGNHSGVHGPHEAIAIIGVLFLSGEFDTALFHARSLRSHHLLSVRQEIQVRALEAAAMLAQGNKVMAREIAQFIAATMDHYRLGSIITHLPASLIGLISEGSREPSGPLQAMTAVGAVPQIGSPLLSAPLSPRERTVLRYLVESRSRMVIAELLDVSVNTVKTQIQSIYRKFGVTSKPELLNKLERLPPAWAEEHDRVRGPVPMRIAGDQEHQSAGTLRVGRRP